MLRPVTPVLRGPLLMCFKVTSIPSPYNMNLVYSFWVSTIGGHGKYWEDGIDIGHGDSELGLSGLLYVCSKDV